MCMIQSLRFSWSQKFLPINLGLWILSPFWTLKSNICTFLNISRVFFIVLWYLLLYLSTILSNLLVYTFLILQSYIFKFYSSPNKSFSSSKLSFIVCFMHLYIVVFQAWFHWYIRNFITLIHPYFVSIATRIS